MVSEGYVRFVDVNTFEKMEATVEANPLKGNREENRNLIMFS